MLGPKYHSLSHFVKMFVDLQGIGPFDEQFVEVSHAEGKKDARRVCGLRDMQKRADSTSRHRAAGKNPDVIQAKGKNTPSPNRKRHNNVDLREAKKQRRTEVLDRVITMINNNIDTQMEDFWNKKSN